VIIPCIDLQGGKAVQLVRGRKRALSVKDVLGLLERFQSYPIMHVIDLDAALRTGSNSRWIKTLCQRGKMKVRVGGGIRSAARAKKILSWGAEKIIVGSAAFKDGSVAHDFLSGMVKKVGRENIIVALDTEGGRIVVRGWRERLKLRPEAVIPELERYCSGFLSTFVDHEGTMKGTDLKWFRKLRGVTKLPITAAGGIRSMREVNALEKAGMHAAVGMAIYTGQLAGEKTGIAKRKAMARGGDASSKSRSLTPSAGKRMGSG
jgi:phosphoribosylformimino-5-aminoimidazole carboxamide ribotide isomerase